MGSDTRSRNTVRCPACQVTVSSHHRFCSHCGQRLNARRPGWRLAALALFCILLMGGGGWIAGRIGRSDGGRPTAVPETPAASVSRPDPAVRDVAPQTPDPAGAAEGQAGAAGPDVRVSTGTVEILDITGRVITTADVPLLQGGWVALPRRICLGGAAWRIRLPDGTLRPVVEGVLYEDDRVGVWKISDEAAPDAPALHFWDGRLSLTWRALEGGSGIAVPAPECREGRYALACSPPLTGDPPGLLMQNGRVVGWTFGSALPGSYLWTDLPGEDLYPELRVDDLYRLTFEGGWEEAVIRALHAPELSHLQRLAALFAAFELERRIAPPLPAHLPRPDAVTAVMTRLIDRMAAAGRTEWIDLFDGRLLALVGERDFARDAVQAAASSAGPEPALALMEGYRDLAGDNGTDLTALHRRLYLEILARAASAGAAERMRAVVADASRWFPDDPEIHLFRVRAAIQGGDAASARELITAMRYPDELMAQVDRLADRIDRMYRLLHLQAEEAAGGIVIRFPPGTRNIRTDATINGRLTQRFLVDTGATVTTLPPSALDALGVTSVSGLPERTVQTAGGPVTAREVWIAELTLGGYAMRNVQAVVLEIPGLQEVGLLGMNVLRRFRIDLDSDQGVLRLTPR